MVDDFYAVIVPHIDQELQPWKKIIEKKLR